MNSNCLANIVPFDHQLSKYEQLSNGSNNSSTPPSKGITTMCGVSNDTSPLHIGSNVPSPIMHLKLFVKKVAC